MSEVSHLDVAVIGGGMVGLAVALGLALKGRRVTIFDEGDRAIRAARANFGLVWVQGKGERMPAYARLTVEAARAWRQVSARLSEETGIDVEFRNVGGIHYCVNERELQQRAELVASLDEVGTYPIRMLSRSELQRMQPNAEFGPDVVGGSYCDEDSEVNPLQVMRALKHWLGRLGVRFVLDPVRGLVHGRPAHLETTIGNYAADTVVVAAGLGNTRLAEQVGLDVRMRPVKGQLVVTERARNHLALPGSGLRQMSNGTFLIGSSSQEVGFDDSADPAVCAPFVRRSIAILPAIGTLSVVRIWAGLRTMTPDGYPIYECTADGSVNVLSCHSAVTLVPVHIGAVAAAINGGAVASRFPDFSARRLHAA